MQTIIAITHVIPYSTDELLNRENFILDKIRSFVQKAHKERNDLANYQLNDIGLLPGKREVLVKLYFKYKNDLRKADLNTFHGDKLIDINHYFTGY